MGVMGRGEKVTPRSRSTLLPIIPLSHFSLVSRAHELPNPHVALEKSVGEAGLEAAAKYAIF